MCFLSMPKDILGKGGRKTLFVKYFNHGCTRAELFQSSRAILSKRTLNRYIKQFEESFHWLPYEKSFKKVGQHKAGALRALKDIIDHNPALYLDEIRDKMRDQDGYSFHVSTICRMIHAKPELGGLGYSLLVLDRRACQKDTEERMNFLNQVQSGMYQHEQMIWIDECRKGRNCARRRRGWGPRGMKRTLVDLFQDAKAFCLLGAANQDGMVDRACWVTDDKIDADVFVWWVEFYLSPILGNYQMREKNCI